MNSLKFKNQINKPKHLILLFVLILMLVVGKDLLHATIKSYTFYLSDSVLFGTFWILFLPLILANIRRSDRKHPFIITLGFCLLHIFLFSFLVYALSSIFFDSAYRFSSVLANTFAVNGITCLIVYGLINYILSVKQKNQAQIENNQDLEKITVDFGNKINILQLVEVIYVKSEKPYIAIITSEKKYLHNCSLKKFYESHASKHFIQIHKSVIINKSHIVSFTSRKNGDYDVEMTNGHIVRASRSYSDNFKSYLSSLSSA